MFSRRFRVVMLLFVAALAAHAPALTGVAAGALPSTGDTLGAFAPWHEFTRQQLHQSGVIPLWNPHLFCGVPFAGNGQSALFYPPTYLHFLLPENLALWLFALLHSWFFMVGGYFLGRTLRLSMPAALLVALLLGLGDATPAHLFGGHLTFLPARSFWPWQAAFLLRILRGDGTETGADAPRISAEAPRDDAANFPALAATNRRKSPVTARVFEARNSIALAACLSLGLGAGAPQIWLFGVLFCGAIAVFWLFGALKNRVSPALWPWKEVALAILLTILWCAPTLLPLRELKNWSSHGETLSFEAVTDLSATPRSLFRLLFSGFFGGNSFFMWSLPSNPGEDGASIGLIGALLALAAPLLARKSRVARAIWLGSALAILLALGDSTPLYRALYEHIGLFRVTRVPARWLELWAFGAALLAGFSFDVLLQNAARARKILPVWTGAALGALLLCAAVFAMKTPWQNGAAVVRGALDLPVSRGPEIAAELQSDALLSSFTAAFALGTLALLWRRGFGSRRQIALIVAVICAEPFANFWLDARISPPSSVQSAQIPTSLAQHFRAGERWIIRAPFQQLNAPLGAGIDALNGYEPFGSAPFFAFAAQAQPGAHFSADFQPQKMAPLWRVMGASKLLWKPKFPGDAPRSFRGIILARAGEWRLYSINDGASVPPELKTTQKFIAARLKSSPTDYAMRRNQRELARREREISASSLKPWPRAYLTQDIGLADGEKAWNELRAMAAYRFDLTPPAIISSDYPYTTYYGDEIPRHAETLPHLVPVVQTPDVRIWRFSPAPAALFVESETMAPGWRAYVDGQAAKIYLANAIFRGVSVPAGTRKLALIYNSQTLRFGLFLALCGLGFAAALLVPATRK